MKKLLFVIIVLLNVVSTNAQPRSELEAKQIASDFFAKSAKKQAPKLSVVSQQKVKRQIRRNAASLQKKDAIHSSCYIINDDANNRFVIVSSDERFYTILGYSNNGAFDPEMAPPALLELLDGYDAQYDYLLENAQTAPRVTTRTGAFPEIQPLIKSRWGQGAPYWDWCPYNYEKNSEHPCVTGCVATALAQVMNYYQFPKRGQDSYSYTTSFGTTLAIDYDTIHFEWDKICDTYIYYYDDKGQYQRVPSRSAEEEKEVAKLMKACGVSVAMGYGPGSSGAYSQDLVSALIKYFGYNPNILFKRKRDFSSEDWDAMILQELSVGHPVLYAGVSSEGGHQFVIDGCNTNGMYHFNFGWSGSSDGYYNLTGTDAMEFESGQDMVYQVTPEEYGIHEDYYSTDFMLQKRKLSFAQKCVFSFSVRYARQGVATPCIPFTGQIGIALFDTDFKFVDTLYTHQLSNDKGSYYSPWNESFIFEEKNMVEGKEYIVALFSKSVDTNEPSLIRTVSGKQVYYLAKVENGLITLSPQGVEIPEIGGVYKVRALDVQGQQQEWYARIVLSKQSSDYDFTIYNIDPAASRQDNSRMCQVSGELSQDGKQLKLSKYVYYGAEVGLMNYSNNNGDIILKVNPDNGHLVITDSWGTALKSDNSVVSQYTNTLFTPVSRDELELAIEVNNAGELINKISPIKRNFITSLTLTGDINGTDVKLIRELAISGSLTHLNLSDVCVVEGGKPYYQEFKTRNGVIGESMFSACEMLKEIILPSNITAIDKYAFYNSDRLESLILPEGIQEIPSYAISFCDNLSYLSIPSSVKLINDYCLSYCHSLRRIDCYVSNVGKLKSSSSRWSEEGDLSAFRDVSEDCEWHVGKGLIKSYTSQSWWKESWSIIDDLPIATIKGDSNDDGEVDVADVTAIINHIMLQAQDYFNFEASDINDDGEVDVTDLTLVINAIMKPEETIDRRSIKEIDGKQSNPIIEFVPSENGNSLRLPNSEKYVSAQFDVVIPPTTTIESIQVADGHQAVLEQTKGGCYRVVVFSMSNRPFKEVDGDWLKISLNSGNTIRIENAILTTTDFTKKSVDVINALPTSLKKVNGSPSTEVYSLDGKKVGVESQWSNRIYIINGKKCIIK